jgi:hypothetical protein
MRRIPLLAVLGCALAFPMAAGADPLTGVLPDPQDSPTNDIASLQVTYDQAAASLRADLTFYAPADHSSIDQIDVTFGDTQGGCAGGVSIFSGFADNAITDMLGTNPDVPFVRGNAQWSADRRTLTLWGSTPQLASFAPTCATAETWFYDDIGHCGNPDCTWWSHTYDLDETSVIVFAAATPPPTSPPAPPTSPPAPPPTPPTPPAPSTPTTPQRATVHLGGIQVYSCRREVILASPSAGPKGTDFTGRLKVVLAGTSGKARIVFRRVSTRDLSGYYNLEFRNLKPGGYRLTAVYSGDGSRAPSKTVVRTFHLRTC